MVPRTGAHLVRYFPEIGEARPESGPAEPTMGNSQDVAHCRVSDRMFNAGAARMCALARVYLVSPGHKYANSLTINSSSLV